MSYVRSILIVLICTGSLAPCIASAHHSPATFDLRKNITVTGSVQEYAWFNPHVYITLEQTLDDGSKREWQVECTAPSMMMRLGWSVNTLHVGDLLTVTGSPGRDPSSKGLLAGTIKRADTTLMKSGDFGKPPELPVNAAKNVSQGLAGTWLTDPSMRVIAQLSLPTASQLTPEGARLLKGFDEKAQNPLANCVPAPMPHTMVLPDMKHITVEKDRVRIESETDGVMRTIHLDATTHDNALPSLQGHSIGKWDGKTLVVDTTNFAYHGVGNGLGVPSGTQKHVTERFTPNADGLSLTYSFETFDPEFQKLPIKGTAKWVYRADLKFVALPCNLDSARRFLQN